MEKLKLNIQLFGGSLSITASETDVSIENNTSYINVSISATTTSGTYNETGGAYVNATLTGQNNTYSIPKTYFKISKGQTKTVYSGKIGPFYHNSDGSLNNVTISASAYIVSNTQPTASISVAMSTIPRASSVDTLSGGTIGQTISGTISRASTSFTHKVYVKLGDRTQILSNNATTTFSGTLDMGFCNGITNSTTSTAFVVVETYDGSTRIGEPISSPFQMTVPSSVVPTMNSVTKSDTTSYYSTYGAYVQSKSTLRVVSSASGVYSSTIASYTVKLKNGNTVLLSQTGSTVDFPNINYTGTITVEVTATDTRNRTAINTSTITVASYAIPSISYLTAERRSNDDTVTLTFNAAITNINNANANAKTFKLEKKKKSDSTWTTLQTYTSAYTYSNNAYTTTCDSDYPWDFRLTATDSFTSSTKTADVGTAFDLINWGTNGNSMAIGKVSEYDNTLEVNLLTKLLQNTNITGTLGITGNTTIGGDLNLPNSLVVNNFDSRGYSNVDANDFDKAGIYYLRTGCSNVPSAWVYILVCGLGGTDIAQIGYSVDNTKIYYRFKNSGTWGSWYTLLDSKGAYHYDSNSNIKGGYFEVWKRGNVCQFVCDGDTSNLPYGENLYITLPYGYRPTTTTRVVSWNNTNYVLMEIRTDGKVYLCNYSGTISSPTNMGFDGIYMTDEIT